MKNRVAFSQCAEVIDVQLGDRSRARCSRAHVAAILNLESHLRGIHIQLMQTALSLRGIGLHELESGAIGLIRISALEGAKHL